MPSTSGGGLEKNWHFSYFPRKGKRVTPPLGDNVYNCPMDCKLDGVLRYVAMHNTPLLSKWVFCLIESKVGIAQRDERLTSNDTNEWCDKRQRKGSIDTKKGYFILHYVERRCKKPPWKIAVVYYLSVDSVLVVSLNDKYYTQQKDCFLLNRTK